MNRYRGRRSITLGGPEAATATTARKPAKRAKPKSKTVYLDGNGKVFNAPKRAGMQGTITVYQDDVGEWRVRVKASNGKVIVWSEGYTSRHNALMAVVVLREIAANHNMEIVE